MKCPNCKNDNINYDGIGHYSCSDCNRGGSEEDFNFIEKEVNPTACSRCGSEYADYIENPYQKDMFNQSIFEWLCCDCYKDCLGDI